jgi:hypothetical protein
VRATEAEGEKVSFKKRSWVIAPSLSRLLQLLRLICGRQKFTGGKALDFSA